MIVYPISIENPIGISIVNEIEMTFIYLPEDLPHISVWIGNNVHSKENETVDRKLNACMR